MDSDASAAYQAGQMAGTITLGLAGLAVLVFFVISLAKAISRKTPGWIITAIVMGLMSGLVIISAVALLVSVIASKSSQAGAITKVVKSTDNKYSITVPNSWRSLPDLNPQAAMAAGNVFQEQYLMVLIENKAELKMDLQGFMSGTADRMASVLKEGKQGEITSLTISGHPALRRSITGESSNIKLAYLHTCIETKDSLVQIICWTLVGREATAFPLFEEVAATFTEIAPEYSPPAGQSPVPVPK